MANTVASPDLALEKFIGIGWREDPTAFIRLLKKKISLSLGSRPAVIENNIQTLYNDWRKTLFGSVLRRPAAEWFVPLEAALTWDELETQFIARLTDGKCSTNFESKLKIWKDSPTRTSKVIYREEKH